MKATEEAPSYQGDVLFDGERQIDFGTPGRKPEASQALPGV